MRRCKMHDIIKRKEDQREKTGKNIMNVSGFVFFRKNTLDE